VALPVVRRVVDVDPPRVDRLGEAQATREVARPDCSEQAVRACVCDAKRLGVVRDGGDRRNRAERLLARDLHLLGHSVQDGGRPVEPRRKTFGPFAPGDDAGAATDGVGDVLVHLRRGRLVVQRAHGRRVVERIAEPHPPGDRLRELLDELVVHGFVHKEPFACGARLPGAEKRRGDARLGGGRDVGVVEHDERPVTAELEQARLPGGARGDLLAGRDGADESDGIDPAAPGDLVADDRPGAGHHVEHARRELGVDEALGEHRAAQ